MINLEKTGKRISSLRRERGYTGEALAERLQVSPQAVSKWENGKCLPETAILPALAEALDCSIDSLLCPRELFILEAIYTDGQTQAAVTRFLDNMVRDNALNIPVNETFMGASIEGGRLKILTVKFQTAEGIRYAYALQNGSLILDRKSAGFEEENAFRIIGAYYGNAGAYSCAMQKMEHYEYFKWDKIAVNHETFPSDTASDDTEYLTLVYLNGEGIHVISCPENGVICYEKHGMRLQLPDESKCILKNVRRLSWEGEEGNVGQMCPWAGSLQAALEYMGEPYTYEQIMGMSGACFRLCFVDVWDYSCTDALVAYDYAGPLYRAVGYSFRVAERLEKQERKAERLAVMEDIRSGRPVLAINLRVAPEWGVITGYTDSGKRFLCRTYFDGEIFETLEQADVSGPEEVHDKADKSGQEGQEKDDKSGQKEGQEKDGKSGQKEGREKGGKSGQKAEREQAENRKLAEERRIVFEENEGYLFSDFWPFIIFHFGEKQDRPSPLSVLKTSLKTGIESFYAEECRGYYQGKEAYRAWINSLSKESDFRLENDRENVLRRLSVNDSMLCCLIDARRAAASWLREGIPLIPEAGRAHLEKMAQNEQLISETLSAFRGRVERVSGCEIAYNTENAFGVCTRELRKEQISILEHALILEEENCRLAEAVLEICN